MDLALGLLALIGTILDVCIALMALLTRFGIIDHERVSSSPLAALVHAAERVTRSQRLQGLVAGLAIAGTAVSVIFLVRAFETEAAAARIISPSESDAVAYQISVDVEARAVDQEEFVLVFVRPLPGDPNQDYFLQAFPQPAGDGRWTINPVYVGTPEDQSGTPFNICAVITRVKFHGGERSRTLPAGSFDCVGVTRE